MRFLAYIFSAVIVAALVSAAAYYSRGFWLPAFIDPQTKQIDEKSMLSLVVVLPAAVSALVVGLLNGFATLLVQRELRAANDALETKKGKIVGELDAKRNELVKDLENYKSDISVRRGVLDESIDQVREARDTMAQYRFLIGNMRHGRYSAEETSPLLAKLDRCGASLKPETELSDAWNKCRSLGHLLEQRCKGYTAARSQRQLWKELSPDCGNIALGIAFARRAEVVSIRCEDEIARLRTEYRAELTAREATTV